MNGNLIINGLLGIGTDSPGDYGAAANNLVIKETGGGSGLTIVSDNNRSNTIYFADGLDDNEYRRGAIVYDHSVDRLYLMTSESSTSGLNSRLAILNTGQVGLGENAPSERLSVNGAIRLSTRAQAPQAESGNGKLFVQGSGSDAALYGINGSGSAFQLSSHQDPRSVSPEAQCSFADPRVALPLSLHHFNQFLGKGAVIDLAALIADLEKTTGRSYVYLYDLPPQERLDYARWQEAEQKRIENELKEALLDQQPEIEIPLSEAWETVEVFEETTRLEMTTQYELDLENLRVVEKQTPMEVTVKTATGRSEKRLKPNVRFDTRTGKCYRSQTREDIETPPVARPVLPDWILMRLSQN